MLHRVLASMDVCISNEIHVMEPLTVLDAVGVSASTLHWPPGTAWSKQAETVEMGSLAVHPLGMGHDTGILRPHVLVTIKPPAPPTSLAASAKAMATSACKPMFSVHRTQAGVKGDSLPVTAEPTPFVGILIGTVCGGPVNTPASLPYPVIPTQYSVFTGMTWGDIIGGFVNIGVDMAVTFLVGLAGKGLSRGNPVAEQIIGIVIPLVAAAGKGLDINLDTGIDNPGRVVQEAIDGDGVGSDAKPGIRVIGFGVEGTGSKGGRTSGVRGVHPWSK